MILKPLSELTTAQWCELIAIEQTAHPSPWTRAQFTGSLAAGHWACARLSAQAEIMAYALLMPNVGDWELLNITVAPSQRSQGLGLGLMQHLLTHCAGQSAAGLILEVRASNAAAIALYTRCGFVQIGLRRGYYAAARGKEREDAIVMRRSLSENNLNLA